MYIEHCVKKHTLPKSDLDKRISFQAIQGHSSIPDPVKNHYIKKYLKIRREKYQIEISDYQKECQTAQQEYDKNLYKRQASAVLKDGKVEELKFPLRPTPDYVFSEFEFKKMINEAIQMRGEWENIKKNLN